MLLTNARLVLNDEVFHGTLQVSHGKIQEIATGGTGLPGAVDCEGDYLLPGFIELHTDNMEKYFCPRPGVDWPADSAFHSHDAQMVAAGITTVFDAVSIGDVAEKSLRLRNLQRMVDAVNNHRTTSRAEHFLHLRCEVSHSETLQRFEQLVEENNVRLVSVMDHSPGQRQFVRMEKYREYYQGKFGYSDEELDEFVTRQRAGSEQFSTRYRQLICRLCHERDIAIASHDDATEEHVQDAVAMNMAIAEFPTTQAAAAASHNAGLSVLMGAPNVVRGGSHSGNVAAHILAAAGHLDILSSDYYPASLLDAAFLLAEREDNVMSIADSVRCISSTPAIAAGLMDRGRLAQGLRGDIVRVRDDESRPRVITVWNQGERVF